MIAEEEFEWSWAGKWAIKARSQHLKLAQQPSSMSADGSEESPRCPGQMWMSAVTAEVISMGIRRGQPEEGRQAL